MPPFTPIQVWNLPKQALADSFSEMALDGARGTEGVMLWLGKRGNGEATISHSVVLRGPGVVKQPAFLRIESELLNEVADLAIELNLSLVAQIHSHGQGYGVDLSHTDRTYGIAVPYYLSIVAPDYALRPDTDIAECGVHIFEPETGFRRFPYPEVIERINITDGLTPVTIVGSDHHG